MTKVAFIIESLSNSAGMERTTTVIANSLCKDYDITIITAHQGGLPLYYPLNPKVSHVDMGVVYYGPSFRDRLKTKKDYYSKLEDLLVVNSYDYTVCLGGMSQYFMTKIKGRSGYFLWVGMWKKAVTSAHS